MMPKVDSFNKINKLLERKIIKKSRKNTTSIRNERGVIPKDPSALKD